MGIIIHRIFYLFLLLSCQVFI
uniref:Uncharacterized protein n=1 Tax=Anguilla anguilla TaxID=7936 RepID=A0A0E9VWW9_ANGAN